MPGFLYILGNESHKYLKIGISKSGLEMRMVTLQTASPFPFQPHLEVLVDNAKALEIICHAMVNDPELSADGAKYFLVVCTAFTNYLISCAASASYKSV